jgi:cytochrome b561
MYWAKATFQSLQPPLRYHPALVALHWLSALLILSALAMGFLVLDRVPNSAAQKVQLLFWHAVLGVTILLVLIARFTVRVRTPRPAPATTGSPLLDRLARLTHYALYAAVALMALSGLATAVLAGLPAIFAGATSGPLPASFDHLPPRTGHAVLARIIVGLVALHLAGAFYHIVVRKDGLMRRMWFDARVQRPPADDAL